MILKSYWVTDFKSITDSGEIVVDDGVTALVGKNESGKTACLEALYRLNPVPSGHPGDFDPLRDFPRPRFAAEQDRISSLTPIEARFQLEQADLDAVAEAVGTGVLTTTSELTVTRSYANQRVFSFSTDEAKAVPHFLAKHSLDPKLAEGTTTMAAAAEALAATGGIEEDVVSEIRDTKIRQRVANALQRRLPRFFYFDEYSELPGRISIPYLQSTAERELNAAQATALSLLRLAGVQAGAEFTKELYEERRASLEAASSLISQEIFEFWSQNKNLRVNFDVDWPTDDAELPADEQRPVLEIRIENLRHFITLNFSERSAGFQWFFSFLAAFSEFRDREGIVLLLDEPALGLHATAQADLLRYFEQRLAPAHQVIYTTHSPFMIDPTRLERARTVEDREEEGTKVDSDVLKTTPETVFPLQAALGYELAQTLFLAPDNLAVEGPSDFVYLQALSGRLTELGREGLDPRWSIVPVGGVDKLPTFIALLGVELNVAVILDGAAGGSQKINSMIDRGLIKAASAIPLATITAGKEADIEDLFEQAWYLKLVKASGISGATKSKLGKGNRIVPRIESLIGPYDHFQPARHLLAHPELLDDLDAGALDRFESLFKQLNQRLS